MNVAATAKPENNSGPVLIPAAHQKLANSKTANRQRARILSGASWLGSVLSLHLQVRSDLPRPQSHFLLPKTAEYFRKLLDGKGGVLFGLVSQNRLVGSMAVLRANSFEAARTGEILTCPDPQGKISASFGEGAVAAVQSLCVKNNHFGRGYSRALIDAAIQWAQDNGCRHLFAQVAAQNTLSWLRFLDHDFAIVSAWKYGHRRFLLRRVSPEEKEHLLRAAASADRHSYRKDYSQMPAALAELSSRLGKGHMVLLNNKHKEAKALPFVFSKFPCDSLDDDI